MTGLGISQYIPSVVYGLSFVVAFLAVFYRSEIGILFLVSLFPVYIVLDKVLKSGLFMANSVNDMVIVAMFLGLMIQGSRKNEQIPVAGCPQLLLIFLFMGYSLFTFVLGTFYLGDDFSADRTLERLADWKNYMYLPLLYILSYYGLRERKWKYLFFILIFFSLLAADLQFRSTFKYYEHTKYMETSRLGGTFAFLNANAWGSFHAMYTLLFIGTFLIDRHFWRRVAYGILIAGGTYCMLYSYSRGAYIGFAVGLVFIALIRSRKLLIPLFVLVLLWKLVLPTSVVDRIEWSFVDKETTRGDVVTIGDAHIETAQRTLIWTEALSLAASNPIVGTGFRTFGKLTGWDTHNQYLKMLAEQGIIGFVIYLVLYWRAAKGAWQLYGEGDEELLRAFGFGFLCAVVGSMVVNFFGDRWTYPQLGGIYWVVWALIDQENGRLKLQRQERGEMAVLQEAGAPAS